MFWLCVIVRIVANPILTGFQVAVALALFQTSTLLTAVLGWRVFRERHFAKRFLGSLVMVVGAALIVLTSPQNSLGPEQPLQNNEVRRAADSRYCVDTSQTRVLPAACRKRKGKGPPCRTANRRFSRDCGLAGAAPGFAQLMPPAHLFARLHNYSSYGSSTNVPMTWRRPLTGVVSMAKCRGTSDPTFA
jgi:hypothetical protein